MATGRIQRQGVDALPRRQRRNQPAQTVDTFVQTQAPQGESEASRVVSGLFEFTGKAMDVAVRREKSKIELDKVTQQQRALQGLDPTDDATKAGIRAYQIVNIRDDVLSTNSELAERIRTNPDMSDEEFEIATREAYSPLLEQYQGDAQLSQALSNKLQESQTQIHQIRGAAQREHRDWQRQESFKTSIEEYREAAGSPQELAAMIDGGQLANEADALGITEQQFRAGLLNMAAMDANSGDGRLLSALENQEWASTDERVGRAREVFQAWDARNNAVEIGTQWGEIQDGWKNRTASWSQTEEAIRRVNERFPGSITANQVASLRQQAAAQHGEDTRKAALERAFWESQGSDRPLRLGTNPLLSDSDRDHLIAQTDEKLTTRAMEMQASGELTPEQAESWILEQRLAFGRQQGVKMPGISSSISSLSGEDPDDWGGEGIPTYFNPALQAISMMNESDIQKYGNDERERNMMRTYQRFLSSEQPDKDAWRRSYRAITNRTNLEPSQRSTLVDNTTEAVNDAVDRSWWQSGRSMPDGLRSHLTTRANEHALSVMGTGGVDPEMAAEAGALYALERTTQLPSGSFVTRGEQDIIMSSGFTDETGREYMLGEQDIGPAFEDFFDTNKESFYRETHHGTDLSIENVYFDAMPNGLVMPYDDWGEPLLDAPVSMQGLTKQYVDRVSEERASTAAAMAEREAREAERQERNASAMAESMGGYHNRDREAEAQRDAEARVEFLRQ